MPELPEVETVRRSLSPLVGTEIIGATVREPRLRRPVPANLDRAITGRTIERLDRRGKYILMRLSGGTTILAHLGMSGTMEIRRAGAPGKKHDHVITRFAGGQDLVFNDPRRFGIFTIGNGDDFAELRNVNKDPLDESLSAEDLWRWTRKRAKPIKNLLMDQTVLAGVGNIYANEALFRAGVRPRRQARRLRRREVERIWACVVEVLREAIELGGSSISDYRDGRGRPGYFQLRLQVYDRDGQACHACGTTIRRLVLTGRSTFYCPICQK